MGKRDLLICSYGLLANEAQKLQSRRWQTLVLDEAQAIKNAETKRDLADSLLEGTESSAKLSAEELMKLIL